MAKNGMVTGYCPSCGRGEGGDLDSANVEAAMDGIRSPRGVTGLPKGTKMLTTTYRQPQEEGCWRREWPGK